MSEYKKKKIILVVDDNSVIKKLMCTYLNKHELADSVLCVGFSKTSDAITFVEKNSDRHTVVLAFIDIIIDGSFDGNFEIVYTLQNNHPNAEIILITGMDRNDPYISVFKEKCLIVVYKPFKLDLIKDIAEAVLDE